MADNEQQINRRRNQYLSFNLKVLFAVLTFLELHIVMSYVSATNPCSESQFWVLNADGTTSCVDCGSCPPGQGLSHECGTKISSNAMVNCIPCKQGISFSTSYDTSSCIPCSAPCSEDQLVNQTCTTTTDVKCAKQCKSKDRYYDELGGCLRCSKCCGDAQDVIEDECKGKLGAASNMICSFHSSVNRCDTDTDTLTPSPQETAASQTEGNTISSPQKTTASRKASTASQKDIATESPKVTITHKNTDTVASSGERHLQGSSKAKDANHQVGLIVGITAPVVLCLALLATFGYRRYCLFSRSRSCSLGPSGDDERGVYHSVNGTAACVMAGKGEKPGKKPLKSWIVKWKPTKTESCNPLCEKNPASLTCACQMATQKESKLLKSLLYQECSLKELCEMLDTDVPKLGDYRAVAKYYGFNHYQIASVLDHAAYPGESTRTKALIESLASSHPDLTVEEFVTVVGRETKRKDVINLLRAFDMAQENEL